MHYVQIQENPILPTDVIKELNDPKWLYAGLDTNIDIKTFDVNGKRVVAIRTALQVDVDVAFKPDTKFSAVVKDPTHGNGFLYVPDVLRLNSAMAFKDENEFRKIKNKHLSPLVFICELLKPEVFDMLDHEHNTLTETARTEGPVGIDDWVVLCEVVLMVLKDYPKIPPLNKLRTGFHDYYSLPTTKPKKHLQ